MPDNDAITKAVERAVIDAHNRFRPDIPNWIMFTLARHLKAVPETAGMAGDDLEPYVLAYWSACGDLCKSEQWEAIDYFCDLWDGGKIHGASKLKLAINAAETMETPPELADLPDALQTLGKVCYHLAILNKLNGQFYMAQRTAGQIVGGEQRCGTAALRTLVRHGILSPIDSGSSKPPKTALFCYLSPSLPKSAS